MPSAGIATSSTLFTLRRKTQFYYFVPPFSWPFFFVFGGLFDGVPLVALLLVLCVVSFPSLALILSRLPRTFSRLARKLSRLPVLVGTGLGVGDPRDELVEMPDDTRGLSEESSRDPVLPNEDWLSDFFTLGERTFFVVDVFSVVALNLVPLPCLEGPLGDRSSPDFSRRGRRSPDFSRRIP